MSARHVILRLSVHVLALVLLTLGASTLARGEDAPKAEHVIIISIDGLRPDAIYKAHAPTLQRLIRQGAYCHHAQTVRPPRTVSSHVSMLTGLDSKRHKVTWNYTRPGYYTKTTVFSIVKQAGLTTAMFFSKKKLDFIADANALDFVHGARRHNKAALDTNAQALASTFARQWSANKYALTFFHIREPDTAGHRHGWMSRAYLQAVAKADQAIGSILTTLERAGSWQKTAMIVTADHGGQGRTHWSAKPENMTIPWLAVGPGVVADLLIDKPVRIYDTAPTALAFLGLTMPDDIDGRVVHEVFSD